jgi:tetratricopeptide (TPR) repeat protein
VSAGAGDTRLLPDALTILARHRPGDPGEPLDRALDEIEDTLADPQFAAWDDDTKAYVWLLAGVAATFRNQSDRSRPDDLDRAVRWLRPAAGPDTRYAHQARVNLASALTDRYERHRRPADIDEAFRLLPPALERIRESGNRMDIGLAILGRAAYARWEVHHEPDDLAAAIGAYREAIACPEPDAGQRAGYLNGLALALRADGRLREAADLFTEVRDLTDWPAAARRISTTNLAALRRDEYRAGAGTACLTEAENLYREAYDRLEPAGDHQFAAVAENLGVVLIHQYRRTGLVDHLQHAARHFQEAAAAHEPGSSGRATATAGFAVVLIEIYERTARIAVIDRAIAIYRHLVDDPATRTAGRCQALGVCLMRRFTHTDRRNDLEAALRLLAEAADGFSGPFDQADRAGALSSEANAWALRFLETGDRDDSDQAVDRAEKAIACAAPGSAEAAVYRSNLGAILLRRSEVLGERAALDRALSEQRAALADLRRQPVPPTITLAALADSLAARALAEPDENAVREASSVFREAVEAARRNVPAQAIAVAERWGKWAARRSDWAEAVEAYGLGLRALNAVVSTQQGRRHKESWLRQARTVPVEGAVAMIRAGSARLAVTALEQGRGVLLSENLPPWGRPAPQRNRTAASSRGRPSPSHAPADKSS